MKNLQKHMKGHPKTHEKPPKTQPPKTHEKTPKTHETNPKTHEKPPKTLKNLQKPPKTPEKPPKTNEKPPKTHEKQGLPPRLGSSGVPNAPVMDALGASAWETNVAWGRRKQYNMCFGVFSIVFPFSSGIFCFFLMFCMFFSRDFSLGRCWTVFFSSQRLQKHAFVTPPHFFLFKTLTDTLCFFSFFSSVSNVQLGLVGQLWDYKD